MKRIARIWICIGTAVLIGAAVAPVSYAHGQSWEGSEPLLASFPSSPVTVSSRVSKPAQIARVIAPLAPEAEVFVSQGISPARANQALSLQRQVAETHLAQAIQTALGSAYAGMWFEPAAAQFHIGVASNASAKTAGEVLARAGITAGVVETPVRSTWDTLIATQSRWNKRLAKLLAREQATTAIDSAHNAVSVTLSTSIVPEERAQLEREAATANANVSIGFASPAQLGFEPKAKKTCKAAPFVKAVAFCEETITSGVGIGMGSPICTAGPMLIEGNETFMLTAGHCFGKNNQMKRVQIKVTSEYPTGGGQKEIGSEVTWIEGTEQDIAEIKVNRPGAFSEALPTPVPALMAEWGTQPKTPHAVGGVQAAELTIPGQAVCHEGMVSGENCGVVKALNRTLTPTEHLVEVTACSDHGDSGGPYFFRTKTGEILMMGIETGGPQPGCQETGPYKSFLEPLVDLPAAPGFGILSTFSGQSLLTTANETRGGGGGGAGPFWHHRASSKEGAGEKITEFSPVTFNGKGGKQALAGEVAGTKVEIVASSAEAKGVIYNNSLQGQIKVFLKYIEPKLVKPELKECTVTIGKANEATSEGHLAWKWNGESKQLEETPQSGQSPDLVFTPAPIASGAEKLPEGTLTEVTLKGAGCGVIAGTFAVKGNLPVTVKPGKVEEWSTTLVTTYPGWPKQHFWNGKMFVGVEPKLIFGSSAATLTGEVTSTAATGEVAVFEK